MFKNRIYHTSKKMQQPGKPPCRRPKLLRFSSSKLSFEAFTRAKTRPQDPRPVLEAVVADTQSSCSFPAEGDLCVHSGRKGHRQQCLAVALFFSDFWLQHPGDDQMAFSQLNSCSSALFQVLLNCFYCVTMLKRRTCSPTPAASDAERRREAA